MPIGISQLIATVRILFEGFLHTELTSPAHPRPPCGLTGSPQASAYFASAAGKLQTPATATLPQITTSPPPSRRSRWPLRVLAVYAPRRAFCGAGDDGLPAIGSLGAYPVRPRRASPLPYLTIRHKDLTLSEILGPTRFFISFVPNLEQPFLFLGTKILQMNAEGFEVDDAMCSSCPNHPSFSSTTSLSWFPSGKSEFEQGRDEIDEMAIFRNRRHIRRLF